ncbi:MAG: ADP-glyceromanno-heptose 6-epimerase [Planctomycetota bacterium]|jgi:ADP-L-glycero-D-manno-heptose 6-epimerase
MIIVTGGAGFIGSAIIAALNNRGITDILVVDQMDSNKTAVEKWKNLRNLSFVDYIEKDDFAKMVTENKFHDQISVVFHLGACTDTTETNTLYLMKNNYEYSKLLAQWAMDSNIRFIYASSAATYGDGQKGFHDTENEIGQFISLNMYAYSKQLFDLWGRRIGLLKKNIGLKYFNVFGPNEYHKGKMTSFVLKSFEQINTTGKVRLFKSHRPEYIDGEQQRDFIYIKDAVDMTLFFLDNQHLSGIFNIGTGIARTWNELANAVFSAMDKPSNIEYIEMPDSIRSQYQYFTQADIGKLRKAGYDKQITPLEVAIKDYVQNYLKQNKYLTGI